MTIPRRIVTDDEIALRAASFKWARSGINGRGKKVVCPDCAQDGYVGGSWVDSHLEHVRCTCGQTVTATGLGQHRGGMRRWGHPCPEERR